MNQRIIVPVSGGKDSQVCLKLAIEYAGKENVSGVFFDTKFEHPLTYQHVEFIESLYGVPIERINNGSVEDLVLKFKRFPGPRSRFCTDRLKIQASKNYYKEEAKKGPFEVWYGMRSDESRQRAKRYADVSSESLYMPHEVLPSSYPKYFGQKLGIMFRLPILDWSEQDVFDKLNGEENPLYAQGAKRVGCFPCLASSDKSKKADFLHDDFGRQQYQKVIWMEQQTGASVWAKKPDDNQQCLICSI
jgi:3'-phosphoadenosine 5'-phosphosulfate sulfotransferase (PAPS reductase)/FAD synthetase